MLFIRLLYAKYAIAALINIAAIIRIFACGCIINVNIINMITDCIIRYTNTTCSNVIVIFNWINNIIAPLK